jgi:acetolactate synthase-1/2/3 large subunit
MAKSKKISVDRRGFLKGAAAGAAALVAKPEAAKAQEAAEVHRPATPAPLPGAKQTASETAPPPPRLDVWTTDRPGSDFMVDVVKTLGFEYVAANPGSAFRGIHESIINYGGNKAPELLTCCHEESSIAMAHGYAKIEGKPMLVMAHGTVGLQHASMAIYNAYADRVPIYLLLGNIQDVAWRRSDVEWAHSVQDAASMVRDYTKWDDAPVSLGHFAESAVRAYKIAMTPPMEPVVIVADAVMQEEPIPTADRGRLTIPKLTLASPPAGDYGAVKQAAKMLVDAENPVIIAGRVARTPEGVDLMIQLPAASAPPMWCSAWKCPTCGSSLTRRPR